jgi:L-fucose mutarotase
VLTSTLQHPVILKALAGAGHGARVLVADGHFPASTVVGPHATVVALNLRPGLVDCIQVLEVMCATVAVEAATVMSADDGPEPEVFEAYRRLIGLPLSTRSRHEFYADVRGDDVALVIQTGELRTYANVLLTLGVHVPA